MTEFYVSHQLDAMIDEYRSLQYVAHNSGRSVNLTSWRSWKTQMSKDKHDELNTYYEDEEGVPTIFGY